MPYMNQSQADIDDCRAAQIAAASTPADPMGAVMRVEPQLVAMDGI